MATKVSFNNRTIIQPGAYAQIKSGIQNPALAFSYGNILLIDTSTGTNYGGGAGIDGTLANIKDAIYNFSQIQDFRSFVKGGLHWLLAQPLFRPNGLGSKGVSNLAYIRAAATTPAEISYTFTGGGSNGGSFTIQLKDEGLVGNGYEGDGTLATGIYVVTAVGSAGDSHTLKITEGISLITLGTYLIPIYSTPTKTQVAAALAIDINSKTSIHGYTAIAIGETVVITSRWSEGNEENSDANLFAGSYVTTGTATGTAPTTLTGGVDGSILTRGYAISMERGITDITKYVLKFYLGTFKGLDVDGNPYDGVDEIDSVPLLVVKSIEFNNLTDLYNWMNTNSTFVSAFKLKTNTIVGDGSVDDTDLTNNTGNNKASDGTEIYDSTKLDMVLDEIVELDYTFVLCDNWGTKAMSINNGKIEAHIIDEAKYRKYMVVGGGKDRNTFSNSIAVAKYYNSNRVITIHGGLKKTVNFTASGFKEYDSIYKAAIVLGRICGLEPQVPVTFKQIDIDGELHPMNNTEVDLALESGVLCTRFDSEIGGFVIIQGINTMQKNNFLISEDGTSFDIAVERISAQLEKEITINAKIKLLANPNGTNRYTLNSTAITVWVENFLRSKMVDTTQDNLIISFSEISAKLKEDNYFVTFGFVPNTPVNKIFFTGFMLS